MEEATSRRIVQHTGPLALLALLTVGWSFPLILDLDGSIPGRVPGDNLTFLWNFWWMRHVLDNPELQFFRTAYLFAPIGVDLTLHTHTALPALFGATALGSLSITIAHNLVILFTLFFNAAAAYFLAYRITGSKAGAVLAASIFGGSPYVMAHLQGHLNLVSAWGLPLYIVLLLETLRSTSWKFAVAAGVCLVAVAYTDYYYLVYAIAFSVVWLAVRWTSLSVTLGQPSPRRLRMARGVLMLLAVDAVAAVSVIVTGGFVTDLFGVLRVSAQSINNELTVGWILLILLGWIRYAPRLTAKWQVTSTPGREVRALFPTVAICAVGLVPLALQAFELWQSGGYVSQSFLWRSAPAGIDAISLVLGNPYHPLWGEVILDLYRSLDLDPIEGVAWVGIVPAFLLWWVWRTNETRQAARPWFLTGAIFLVWSLGPFLNVLGKNVGLILPQTVVRLIPIVANARIPGRAMVIVYLALGVIAAIAVAKITFRRTRVGVAMGLTGLVVFDYLAAPFPLHQLDRPEIYRTLASAEGPGVVCELPLGVRDGFGERGRLDHRVLFYQSIHERPLVGGFMARLPQSTLDTYLQTPVIDSLLRLSAGAPIEKRDTITSPSEVVADLQQHGIRWFVLNRQTSPPHLIEYVETVLPLRLVERKGERELYVVAE